MVVLAWIILVLVVLLVLGVGALVLFTARTARQVENALPPLGPTARASTTSNGAPARPSSAFTGLPARCVTSPMRSSTSSRATIAW